MTRAVVLAELPAASTRVCGLTLLERTLRALAQAGCTEALVLSSDAALRAAAADVPWPRATMAVTARARLGSGPLATGELRGVLDGPTLVVPDAGAWDTRLVAALRATGRSPVALVDTEPPARYTALLSPARRTSRGALCGPAVLDEAWTSAQAPDDLVVAALAAGIEAGEVYALDVAQQPDYVAPMRRHVRPVWFPAPPPGTVRQAESMVLDAAQKGVLDLPAVVHAPIETFLVSLLCRTGITPNQLTVISALTAWFATALFATGHLAAGIAVALSVGVIDGLDGKQARVKLETSEAGELEHWSDFAYELSWWTALAWHFQHTGAIRGAFLVLGALYLAEAVDGLTKLTVKRRFGRMIDDFGPAMRAVRLVGGRRNVYAWIMAAGIVLGMPAAAYRLLPWWEGATAVVHLLYGASLVLTHGRKVAVAGR